MDEQVVDQPVENPVEAPQETEVQSPEETEVQSPEIQQPQSRREALAQSLQEHRKERSRDTQGKFAKEQSSEPAKEAPKPREYPRSWKKDYEPLFRKLEASEEFHPLLDYIPQREQEFHKGIEQYKTRAQQAEEFEKAVAPYMATIQTLNMSPVQAAQQLFNADHQLRYADAATKQRLFANLAKMYGVDLNLGQSDESQQIDPNVAALQREISQLKGELQRGQQQAQTARNAEIVENIATFAQGKEHFEAVRSKMSALLQSGEAKDLQDAYDQAVWLVPDIRDKILSEQAKAKEAERQEQARVAAEKAKASAVQVKGSPAPGQNAKPTTGDRRSQIASAVRDRIH